MVSSVVRQAYRHLGASCAIVLSSKRENFGRRVSQSLKELDDGETLRFAFSRTGQLYCRVVYRSIDISCLDFARPSSLIHLRPIRFTRGYKIA